MPQAMGLLGALPARQPTQRQASSTHNKQMAKHILVSTSSANAPLPYPQQKGSADRRADSDNAIDQSTGTNICKNAW